MYNDLTKDTDIASKSHAVYEVFLINFWNFFQYLFTKIHFHFLDAEISAQYNQTRIFQITHVCP